MPAQPRTVLQVTLPAWVDAMLDTWEGPLASDGERMRLAVALSALNVERGGGPFAALVFAGERCVGLGVNRVVDSGFSIAHAEIVALMVAQARVRDRLCPAEHPRTLVTTTDPCCQCFGALVWAGVERLVCGATTADAELIGFDEGPKPGNWVELLEQRGVDVRRQVLQEEAAAVLRHYASGGGTIYNAPAL
ncbi:MAG: nucleoside deaminase [Myxococcales bacterium]